MLLDERRRDSSLAKVYDRVSSTYDTDWNGIYKKSRRVNIHQILAHLPGPELDSALDLAVGTGNAFHDLQQDVHIKQRIGNDISPGMLAVARKKLSGNFTGICDDVLHIEHHVRPKSQDLVLCHFMFSYVDPDQILARAYRLLKPGGLLSIASSTQQALAEVHRDYFPYARRLLKVDASLARATTPKTHASLCETVARHGFEVVERHHERESTSFHSFKDVSNWALGSGWAAQYFDRHYWLKRIGATAWCAGARILHSPFYPVTATNDISLLLARK